MLATFFMQPSFYKRGSSVHFFFFLSPDSSPVIICSSMVAYFAVEGENDVIPRKGLVLPAVVVWVK